MHVIAGERAMGKQQARLYVLHLWIGVLIENRLDAVSSCKHPQDMLYGDAHVT